MTLNPQHLELSNSTHCAQPSNGEVRPDESAATEPKARILLADASQPVKKTLRTAQDGETLDYFECLLNEFKL